MQFINATIFLENDIIPQGYVTFTSGSITSVGSMGELSVAHNGSENELDLSGLIVAPGFIDQHIHGSGGADVMDTTPQALATISKYLAVEGTTSFLATTVTISAEKIHEALRNAADFHQLQQNSKAGQMTTNFASNIGRGAQLLGIHLEGPFISERFNGAQNAKYIRKPDIDLFESFQNSAEGLIKLVTYAVETDSDHVFLDYLQKNKVVASCGHSAASYTEVAQCAESGLVCLTHFHNAMSGHHHREPGVVTAGFCIDSLYVEVIADNVHIHPAVLKMIYRSKGKDAIILITDALRAKGLPDGHYELGEQSFSKKEQTCYLDSGVLAGSVLTMDQAVRNMVRFTGCSLAEAVQMASLNPARLLGLTQKKGSIAPGKDADLVVLDREGNVHMTVVGGQICYRKDI